MRKKRKGYFKIPILYQVLYVISLLLSILCDKNHCSHLQGNESDTQRREMTHPRSQN